MPQSRAPKNRATFLISTDIASRSSTASFSPTTGVSSVMAAWKPSRRPCSTPRSVMMSEINQDALRNAKSRWLKPSPRREANPVRYEWKNAPDSSERTASSQKARENMSSICRNGAKSPVVSMPASASLSAYRSRQRARRRSRLSSLVPGLLNRRPRSACRLRFAHHHGAAKAGADDLAALVGADVFEGDDAPIRL